MVKREEVEALLREASENQTEDTFYLFADTMAELCRLWLAVDGAPVGVVKEVGGSMVVIGGLSEPFRASAKPVKLVLVPEAGGGEG